MYWNALWRLRDASSCAININMRCIEINLGRPLTARNTRLTLTWDVLKFNSCIPSKRYGMININMRCIEIKLVLTFTNVNYRLTLTWDVLKLAHIFLIQCAYDWLTLTWDVLKFRSLCAFFPCALRLTLTWDVLK